MGLLTKREHPAAPPLARKPKTLVGEISTAWARTWDSAFGRIRRTLWPSVPAYGGTVLSYESARAYYRNDQAKSSLGAGFARRIINSVADFMELPRPDSGDEVVDEFLNKCMTTFWNGKLYEAFRDVARDGDTVLRLRRHDMNNPLVSAEEWESCYLEVIPPESCAIYYKEGGDALEIDVAYVRHTFIEREDNPQDLGRVLRAPTVREHNIIEEITAQQYRYWDETAGKWRDDLQAENSWGFVPLLEMHNEFDSTLGGGHSDLEPVLPFIQAFHDVMAQALTAHKAHAIPKAKFKVNDVMQFIASNWPDAFQHDANGQPMLETFNGEISWKGTEILFFGPEEDGGYMEVKSALGDSKTLLDFLLTCISIASETPKTILMNASAQDADEMVPFSKKINRKRAMIAEYVQVLCKMVLAVNHMEPVRVPLVWGEITPDLALKKAQTLQQEVMSTEVMATRQVISDATVRRHLAPFITGMKPGSQEAQDAKKNVIPASGAPTSTQAVSGADSGNKKVPGNAN